MLDANGSPEADTITFADGLGTTTLMGGQLDITETVSITDPAAGQTISGNDNSRIFAVTVANQALTLENLTFTAVIRWRTTLLLQQPARPTRAKRVRFFKYK